MPVHLDSFIPKEKKVAVFASLLTQEMLDACDQIYTSEDKKYIHTSVLLKDVSDGTPIGSVVYTLRVEESAIQIIDVDITLLTQSLVKLRFEKKLPWSSDSNEYYFAFVDETEQAVEVETVNRHAIHQEILDTVQPVYASAFPFTVEVYEDLAAASSAYGFGHPVKVPALGDDFEVSLFSETFSAPGSLFRKEGSEESFSFLFGTVRSIRPTELQIGEERVSFLIVELETAFGLLPTAMSAEVFDLEKLTVGAIVVMYADIKADLAAGLVEKKAVGP